MSSSNSPIPPKTADFIQPGFFRKTLYFFSRWICRLGFVTLWRMDIFGKDNVPKKGALILAPNHVSLADPPVVGGAFPRPIFFMAKKELFDIPFLGWYIAKVNAFPIKRVERDVAAFKIAQRVLSQGNPLIVFPEGRRRKQRDGQLSPAKAGVGMLSFRTKTPVLPIYLHNTDKFSSLGKLTVRFGKPLYPSDNDTYQTFSNKVVAAIAQLKEHHLGIRN